MGITLTVESSTVKRVGRGGANGNNFELPRAAKRFAAGSVEPKRIKQER